MKAERLLIELDLRGIAASSGSACTAMTGEPSHVLRAIGCDRETAEGSLCFTLGRWTTSDEIDLVLDVLPGRDRPDPAPGSRRKRAPLPVRYRRHARERRGAGRAAFARALEEMYGTAGTIERYDFRGKTDPHIVDDLMTEAGLDVEQIRARVEACFRAYARELTRIIGDGARVQSCPAWRTWCAARRATGRGGRAAHRQRRAGARIKLAPTGLWPFFRVGAYGSDDADRRRLPAIARQRARALGHEFPFDRVTIIGDTPLDIDCARACGAVAVAVATGLYPVDELAACRPDLLFNDFADVERVVARWLTRA